MICSGLPEVIKKETKMKLTKSKLKQLIKEEMKEITVESSDWDLVVELDELIPRLQRVREVLHVRSGVFEGKDSENY
jgi:hypothetical protein